MPPHGECRGRATARKRRGGFKLSRNIHNHDEHLMDLIYRHYYPASSSTSSSSSINPSTSDARAMALGEPGEGQQLVLLHFNDVYNMNERCSRFAARVKR